MNKFGFASRHRNYVDFLLFINMVVALPFVPIEDQYATVEQLRDDFPEYLQPLQD
jgi:hypothetical protein